MSDPNMLASCRFCSVISQNNGEDPIGTAGSFDRWLIVELALPWTEKSLRENPGTQLTMALARELYQAGVKIRPMAIAPDREYSQPGYTRVFYYHRPAEAFADYEKQEFWVPDAETTALTTALLKQSEDLSRFAAYRQDTRHIREILVCTHGNIDVACSRFGYPIYKKLRDEYAGTAERKTGGKADGSRQQAAGSQNPKSKIQNSSAASHLRLWRCSHFGGHHFAPTLVDFPSGRFWGHLNPEILDTLVHSTGSVTDLRRFYRGWSGLTRFEQIVERELWMQHGWPWLTYQKAGQTLAVDTTHGDEHHADWADVRINFESPDGRDAGAYEARVEVCGEVMTQLKSGEEHPLKPVKQYRVAHLHRIG